MSDTNSVSVRLRGREFRIRGEEDPEQLQRVAGYLDETMARVVACSEAIGKVPVEVNDSPGFVSNRVLMPMINEAAHCLMEGVSTPEGVDAVMKIDGGSSASSTLHVAQLSPTSGTWSTFAPLGADPPGAPSPGPFPPRPWTAAIPRFWADC